MTVRFIELDARKVFTLMTSLLIILAPTISPAKASAAQPACMQRVPPTVKYRPSLPQCGGKAAVILSGKYLRAFSVVVRDHKGNDRDPLNPECAENLCSPFKEHHRLRLSGANVHCLGASGDSQVYKTVRRVTIKKTNPVRDIYRDIDRFCLKNGSSSLN